MVLNEIWNNKSLFKMHQQFSNLMHKCNVTQKKETVFPWFFYLFHWVFNLNYIVLDLRNLQEQGKKASCYKNCTDLFKKSSSYLKDFVNYWSSGLNFKSCSHTRSELLETKCHFIHFFWIVSIQLSYFCIYINKHLPQQLELSAEL